MYFFDEIKQYVGFSPEDTERLQRLKPSIEPHFEAVVDRFYELLQRHEYTREVFEGPEQIERLRGLLEEWLEELFTGPHDRDYWNDRRRVGHVHVEVGVEPRYFIGAMNLIRIELLDRIDSEDLDVPAAKARASIERILDLDLTIISTAYWERTMEQKSESASALARGLAHEIGNPLNSIRLNLTLLERRLEGDGDREAEEVAEPVLESVRRELDRVEALTNDIQDFAEPLEVDQVSHDAQNVLDDLADVHGPTLEATGIDFELEAPGDVELYCDADRIKQALLNLVRNAAEAIESQGTIRVGVEEAGGDVRITVEDDGEGMKPTETGQIFDLFYTSKPSGTGIGLPIVKKIVDAHEGSLDVRSRPGEGTTFRISLPASE